ncbi:unnamed protein product [Rotaria sp. Silwood2]|nr:unnamed protein product [Rotaria sp. Silwood2]CAF4330350.1 unnamed protein product [Rotaria sp. Silwood2]
MISYLIKFDFICGLFSSVIGLLSLWIFVEWRQCQEKKFKSDSMISTTKCNEPLHWNPLEEQRGFGDLIIKFLCRYIRISQQTRQPTFDCHGAWLTMGNIELHLIKGIPVIPPVDNI